LTDSKLKEQILKAIFREIGHAPNRSASLTNLINRLDYIHKDTFFDTIFELINDDLLYDRAYHNVAFTPDGLEKARLLINPPPMVNQNTINAAENVNSMIQQSIHSLQTQCSTGLIPPSDELQRLVELMTNHLSELNLSPANERKAWAQLATIEAQLIDIPNPTIIKEAGSSLKNITEDAICSLLATAAQPRIWSAVKSILAML